VTYHAGAGCDDGDACTTGEACNAGGLCTGGTSTAVCGDGVCNCGESGATCSADCAASCPSGLSLATWDSGADGWTWGGLWRRDTGGYMTAGSSTSYCSSYTQDLTYGSDLDLSGCASAMLSFLVRLRDDPDYSPDSDKSERLSVRCSGDGGGSWTNLTPSPWPSNQSACSTSYCDGGEGLDRSFAWTSQVITLPAACRTTRVRFQFRATGSCVWRIWYWYVDTVRLN
jgi:hypothetical protein